GPTKGPHPPPPATPRREPRLLATAESNQRASGPGQRRAPSFERRGSGHRRVPAPRRSDDWTARVALTTPVGPFEVGIVLACTPRRTPTHACRGDRIRNTARLSHPL